MSDLVGNPEDRFSHNVAHMERYTPRLSSRISGLLKNRTFLLNFTFILIHCERVPLLHGTVVILCYERDGLIEVLRSGKFFCVDLVMKTYQRPSLSFCCLERDVAC